MNSPSGLLSVIAGVGIGTAGDGEAATAATLNYPSGLAFDLSGNLPISGDNAPATRATFFFPRGVAVEPFGSIFIADTLNNRVRATKGPLP